MKNKFPVWAKTVAYAILRTANPDICHNKPSDLRRVTARPPTNRAMRVRPGNNRKRVISNALISGLWPSSCAALTQREVNGSNSWDWFFYQKRKVGLQMIVIFVLFAQILGTQRGPSPPFFGSFNGRLLISTRDWSLPPRLTSQHPPHKESLGQKEWLSPLSEPQVCSHKIFHRETKSDLRPNYNLVFRIFDCRLIKTTKTCECENVSSVVFFVFLFYLCVQSCCGQSGLNLEDSQRDKTPSICRMTEPCRRGLLCFLLSITGEIFHGAQREKTTTTTTGYEDKINGASGWRSSSGGTQVSRTKWNSRVELQYRSFHQKSEASTILGVNSV